MSAAQPGAKALALLSYLALEPGPHSREELAGLLWGESSDAEARASLRQALRQLRSTFGEIVSCDRAAVELVAEVECDVLEFRRLILQEPRRAIVFDASRFLAGFSVRHAPLYDEWVAQTRRELLRQHQQSLGTLAREAMGQWRWRDAVEFADQWLTAEPLSDEAARLAIEARYLAGDRGAALARYAEYRAHVIKETGGEPSRSLVNLVHRVESDVRQVNARPISDEWYARAPSFEASLIGREKEWAALAACWKAVRHGSAQIALIEGEAGVGKSRLANEFLRWVVADGGTVLRGRGYDVRGSVPFEPVVEVLRDALAAPGLAGAAPEWLTEVARLFPDLRQRFPTLPGPAPQRDSTESWRLFEGVAQLVLAIAEQPVVISLDDLQWLDTDSCNLFRFLIRRSQQAPVLWLLTVTPGELERDTASARFYRLLRARPHAAVISLGPLSEDQLWQMVREMGHVSTPTGARRFANRIFGVSAGNPFYIIELLKTMFAQGLLAVDAESGEWTASAEALSDVDREFPLSQTVHDVIAERVERLPEQLSEALISIAVAGTGCRADVLSHMHGISRLHAAAIGDALVERRLVVEAERVYRCAHPVIAHVVRDGLTASRRREVHRTLALALERVIEGQESGELAREIASHADRGGEPALAYRFAILAAESAIQRYAFEEALSWLDIASSNAPTEAESDRVNQRTAHVLEAAGWSEAPPAADLRGPLTRELQREDVDLPVR